MTLHISKPRSLFEQNKSQVILNMSGVEFIDHARASRFAGKNWGELGREYLDSTGHIVSLPEGDDEYRMIMFLSPVSTISYNAGWQARMAGQYILKWQGGGENIRGVFGNLTPVRIAPRHYRITVGAGVGNSYIAWNAADGFVRNVNFYREEDEAQFLAGQVFRDEWIAPFKERSGRIAIMRFMDWQWTNGPEIVELEEYPTIANHAWRPRMPLEIMVALCNEVGANPWFCIPHLASVSFIEQFAAYVRDNLSPSLSAIYELSNEVWNFMFRQSQNAITAGRAYFGFNQTEPAGNSAYLNYHGMQSTRMCRVIDRVYGDQRNYLTALAWQRGALPGNLMEAPMWRAKDPEEYIAPYLVHDIASITSYFGTPMTTDPILRAAFDEGGRAALTDALEQAARVAPQAETATTLSAVNSARAYGLPLVPYEGGHHIELENRRNQDLMITRVSNIPNGSSFQVGERVVQSGTDAAGEITEVTSSSIDIWADPGSWFGLWNGKDGDGGGSTITGQTSGAVASVEGAVRITRDAYHPVALMAYEDAILSDGNAEAMADNRDNWLDAGGCFACEYLDQGPPSKYGQWGRRRFPGDDNPVWLGLCDWMDSKPRNTPFRWDRRTVDWPDVA